MLKIMKELEVAVDREQCMSLKFRGRTVLYYHKVDSKVKE